MKKITSAILAIFLLLITLPTVCASNDAKLTFSLEYNGKHVETVKTGSEIKVDYYIEKRFNSDNFKIYSHTNEIDFDETFFEYVGKINTFSDGVTGEYQSYINGMNVIKFIGSHISGKTYDNKQYIGSFILKVKATSGEGIVKCGSERTTASRKSSPYQTECDPLKIIVDNDAPDSVTLTFNPNGGNSINPVVKNKGENVDLSQLQYAPTKSGYDFKGWYTDNTTFANQVTSITLNENTTVYAKWEKEYTGSTGGGGISTTYYKLTFETNGGKAVESIQKARNTAVDLTKYTSTKEGYSFEGWYSDKELTKKITEIKMTKDTTIYANWTEKSDEIFNGSTGGKPPMLTEEHYAYILGLFRPNDFITRAEVVTLINRVLNRQPESKADLLDKMITPPDNTDENAWYYLAVQEAVNSHNFEKKSDNIHEKWTELTDPHDWSNLNK